MPFSTTVDILSRVSAAGVDPYTVVVGQKLGSLFHMTVAGRQKILDALGNLQSFASIGKILWFGFGINHLVREMGKTEEGQLCLALCASISEIHQNNVAAEVLLEIAKTSKAPDNLLPSIFEWMALLDACAGILSATSFPELAKRYISLHPVRRGLSYEPVQGIMEHQRGCSSPESLAKALLAIAQVTRGELDSVTIIGGADAGWLAAFAEWFFQLSVHITLASTGKTLYLSGEDNGLVQLEIIYDDRLDNVTTDIQTTGRTFRLADATAMIQDDNTSSYGTASVAGRIPWKNALYSVFGTDFQTLSSNRQAFAGGIGSLARIVKSIAAGEGVINSYNGGSWRYNHAESYGKGLVAKVNDLFPELASFRDIMESEVRNDISSALSHYEAYITALKTACNCKICKGIVAVEESYCLVLILEVIFSISCVVSLMDLPIPLSPTRLGFEVYCARQFGLRRDLDERETSNIGKRYEKLGNVSFVLESMTLEASPLWDALTIFCGRPHKTRTMLDREVSAVNSNGICAYWAALGKVSSGCLASRMTVVPGWIELNGKRHRMITDMYEGNHRHWKDAFRIPGPTAFEDLSLWVRETDRSLKLGLRVFDPISNKITLPWVIPPARAISTYAQAKGRLVCEGRGCPRVAEQLEAVVTKEAHGLTVYQLARFRIAVVDVDIVRGWALTSNSTSPKVLFFEHECIDCCLKTAMACLRSETRPSELDAIVVKISVSG
ncbi:MAG: hypothetical protein Q9165_007852 [Trypethelium subeluteriae]